MLDSRAERGDEKYYGFKGHLVMSLEGVITGFSLTPANGSERDALWSAASDITGLLIGDKGYLGNDLQQALLDWGIDLQTAKRSNMKDSRDRHWVKLLVKTRRLVETSSRELRRAKPRRSAFGTHWTTERTFSPAKC